MVTNTALRVYCSRGSRGSSSFLLSYFNYFKWNVVKDLIFTPFLFNISQAAYFSQQPILGHIIRMELNGLENPIINDQSFHKNLKIIQKRHNFKIMFSLYMDVNSKAA